MKDLIVLVADKNMRAAFSSLLNRHAALGIRQITFDIYDHVHHDPGCRTESDSFLSSFKQQYAYALVVFDLEGCGDQKSTRIELEQKVAEKCANAGWAGRVSVIVLDPELEIWWPGSSHVEEALAWRGRPVSLRQWLVEKNWLENGKAKPGRPKEALEAVLRETKKPRSSAIYQQIANQVSLEGHQEPAFIKFKQTLQQWFPEA